MTDRRSGDERRSEPRGPDRRRLDRAGDQDFRFTVAARLKAAQQDKGYTLKATATRAGVHFMTVHDAVNGLGNLTLSTIIALADVFEIPLPELMRPENK